MATEPPLEVYFGLITGWTNVKAAVLCSSPSNGRMEVVEGKEEVTSASSPGRRRCFRMFQHMVIKQEMGPMLPGRTGTSPPAVVSDQLCRDEISYYNMSSWSLTLEGGQVIGPLGAYRTARVGGGEAHLCAQTRAREWKSL